ncbi:MAG: 3-oxoacyl-ACP reductase FabG [Gammaproteobacteria bacterium]|nr:3-oxoacyl-ACP reductase FabG [Gammaproteobacteria bacterium]
MLDKKVTLVTGASRGIGKSIAIELGKDGARVIGTATSEKGAKNITDYLTQEGIDGVGMVLDVRSSESIDQCMSDIKAQYGNVDILVNNAGITRDTLLMRMKLDQWEEVYETNLRSVFLLSKACLRGMMKNRAGRIINISSLVGTTGNPGQSNYASTKAGMVGFTKSLAREVANRGVTVNCVAPGFIATDMTDELSDEQKQQILATIPMGKLGEVEDIAKAVKYLASDDSAYITGHTMHINGGLHME